jgi:hypothetical protein
MNVLSFVASPNGGNGGTLITFDRSGSAVAVRRAHAPCARALTRVDAASLDLAVAEFLATLAREGDLLEREAS